MANGSRMKMGGETGRPSHRRRAGVLPGILALVLLVLSLTPAPARADPPAPAARLAFVGDIMIGRHVGEQIAVQGTAYPFDPIKHVIADADVAFGNMESPLTTTPRVVNGYDLRAEPAYAEAVALAGFDVLSLANNHATDNGRDGLRETMQTLADLGIEWTGAGETANDARAPVIRQVDGLRIAFLAYDGLHATLRATETDAGCNWLKLNQVTADVAAARNAADVVVVSFHWGVEYQPLPTTYQRNIARRVADAGADIIIGHHPHVVQPVEWVQGKGREHPTLVAYSLGNFLFDQYFSDETMQSAILSCIVTSNGVQAFGLRPVQNYWGQTFQADASNGRAVLRRLRPDASDPGWQVVNVSGGEADPTVWWVRSDPRRPADEALIDFDDDGISERVVVSDGKMRVYTAGNVTLASPAGWFVRGWSALPASDNGRCLMLFLTEPPAWGDVSSPEMPGRLWPRAGANRPMDRMYLFRWSDQSWELVYRSGSLSGGLHSVTCQDVAGDSSAYCVGLEADAGGQSHVTGWRWDGRQWRRLWADTDWLSEDLAVRDMDGDGLNEVLARSRYFSPVYQGGL